MAESDIPLTIPYQIGISEMARQGYYELSPALSDFWKSDKRYKILHGGRASSKSHDAAGIVVFLAANFYVKVLCARRFQNKISESVKALIEEKIDRSPYRNDFIITNNRIEHKITGSVFLFYGIERNLAEIKSLEGVTICWLEEAQYLTEEHMRIIVPTIRQEGSQLWLIFNPLNYTDYIYQNYVLTPPENAIVREINWNQNPFLSNTMREEIRQHYRRDPEEAKHIYGGKPLMNNDKAVIPYLYVEACIDAHVKLGFEPSGKHQIGYDVADDGGDRNAMIHTHGNVTIFAEEWKGLEDQILKSTTKVFDYAVQHPQPLIVFDTIGVGAHVGSKIEELNEGRNRTQQSDYHGFNAGGGVEDPDDVWMRLAHTDITNRDHFSNAKAQAWESVATRMRHTYEAVNGIATYHEDEYISIISDLPFLKKLCLELSSPQKDVDNSGRFKVESKKDMWRNRQVPSPNLADAFIMSHLKVYVQSALYRRR